MNHKIFKIYFIVFLFCGQLCLGQHMELEIATEYWQKGEKEKAYQAFKSMARDQAMLSAIHPQWVMILTDMGKFREAHDHCDKMIRKEPSNTGYKLDGAMVYLKEGDLQRSDRLFREIITGILQDLNKVKEIAVWFQNQSLPEYAELTYRQARAATGDEYLYAMEMANVLRIQGKKTEMAEEYLNYVTQSPGNITYIKNLLQYLLTKPEEQEELQSVLIRRVQLYPDAEVFADLLCWSMIQQKNFNGAFIQSRAYDKRFGKGFPSKTLELAQVAFNNGDYETAVKSYEFIIRDYPATDSYLSARIGIIRTREAQVRRRYPVNRDSVRYLIAEYRKFTGQFPDNANSYEARISQARLYALHLNELDSASMMLDELVTNPRAGIPVKARAKMELGDIYVVRNEPWEATLLFSQVEKMQKDSPLGYEAKLRNARLSYYRGDFRLAEEHLDILKQATSREISNDALSLSLRIKENTMQDTIGTALKIYAAAELLLYQNKRVEALHLLNLIKPGKKPATVAATTILSAAFKESGFTRTPVGSDSVSISLATEITPGMITDDVYWLEADIRRKGGEFAAARELLLKIVAEFPEDVLADDAAFTAAEIQEQDLRETAAAMESYREFLTKYPGSVYAAEARKRFRTLRGDFSEQMPVN
ncbi:MAG: tetratricopeptide repeat protein [Bacteroidota bacterium]